MLKNWWKTYNKKLVLLEQQRSRRVLLHICSAIFKLNIAKFQTFACNSRTVRSSFMKFRQWLETIKMFVCTKFWGNRSFDFGLRFQKPPRKFGVKSDLIQKQLKYGKKHFTLLYILRNRHPLIPNNPLLVTMRFFFFFLPKSHTLFFS